MKIAKFQRADGHEFHAEETSEQFRIMTNDGSFTRIDEAADAAPEKPLSKMNKVELLAEAEKRGLDDVTEDHSKAQIIAAIEAKDQEADSDNEDDETGKTADVVTEKPLAKMNKLELLAEAEKRGLDLVPDAVSKAQIIAAIEAKDAEPAGE
jgi:hypothetical protein